MSSYEESPRQRVPTGTSGKAIISLVLGILCFCLPCVAAIPALALGFFGLKDIDQSGGRLTGKGLAIAGMITSVLGSLCGGAVFGGVLFGGFGLALPGIGGVREAANRARSTNDLKQIGIALINYHDSNGRLPASANRLNPKDPPFSWRVAILPYIEEDNLYRVYRFDEPWDGPNNRLLLDRMPKLYSLPAAGSRAPANETYFQMFVGPGTVGAGGPDGRGVAMSQISKTNGTSRTFLVVEAANSVPWTKPEDLPYSVSQPVSTLGGHFRKVFLAQYCDGNVTALQTDGNERELRNSIVYDSSAGK